MIMKMMQEQHQERITHLAHRKQVFDTVSPDKNQIQERIYQEQQNKKEKQMVTPAKMPSENVVLDTNVIINLLAYKSRIAKKSDLHNQSHPQYRANIHYLLKKSGGKIILTVTALGESTRQLGWDHKTIMNNLKEEFGERLQTVSTTSEVAEHAKELEKKYEEQGLHNPDSIIVAIAKKMNVDIITSDKSVIECCREEKIGVFDHRNMFVPEKRRPPKSEKKVPNNKRYSLDEIDQEFEEKVPKDTPKT